MLTFNHNKKPSRRFELNLIVKNAQGQPTGVRRSIATDNAAQLWSFWMRHQGRPHRIGKSKKKKKKEALPTAKEADQILQTLYSNNTE